MSFLERFRSLLPKEKTPEELEEHYNKMEDLEKKDYIAMLIAAFITFMPIVIIALLVFYGILWLLVI